MPFEFTLQDKTYTTDSLTLDEAVLLEEELGKPWSLLSPTGTAREYQAIARVLLTRDFGAEQAAKLTSAMTISEIPDSVRWVGLAEDD